MKFAFSTDICPAWDIATVAVQAKALGYDGVELCAAVDGVSATASAPTEANAPETVRAFADAGATIACLAIDLSMPTERRRAATSADAIRRGIDLATMLGAPLVKVLDAEPRARMNLPALGLRLTEWIDGLGDYAAGRGVGLAVENALTFRRARDLWLVLDQPGRANVGAAWDAGSAALAGESPWTSVPLLNSRIRYVRVWDAPLRERGGASCALGEGDVPVRILLERLRGVGYGGYVTLARDRSAAPSPAEPLTILTSALETLRRWTLPPAPPAKAVPARHPAR